MNGSRRDVFGLTIVTSFFSLILIGIIIFEFFYYSNKIDNITSGLSVISSDDQKIEYEPTEREKQEQRKLEERQKMLLSSDMQLEESQALIPA